MVLSNLVCDDSLQHRQCYISNHLKCNTSFFFYQNLEIESGLVFWASSHLNVIALTIPHVSNKICLMIYDYKNSSFSLVQKSFRFNIFLDPKISVQNFVKFLFRKIFFQSNDFLMLICIFSWQSVLALSSAPSLIILLEGYIVRRALINAKNPCIQDLEFCIWWWR